MKIKNFVLIIGSMKCGTTSLFEYLSKHPQISSCTKKEPLFFCNSAEWSKGFDYYQSLWKWNPQVHEIALEATASYTRVTHPSPYHMNAAENIAKFQKSTGTNFKFIYIMRNPIERIESHYTQGRKYQHKDTQKSLSEGINHEIIDTSKYAMQLDEYYKRFNHNDILLLNFDDLKSNPQLVTAKIFYFLGLDLGYQLDGLHTNHNQYSSKVDKVMIPGYYILRNTEIVTSLIRKMPQGFRTQCKRKVMNLFGKTVDHEYVKLSPQQKQYVLAELKHDLKELDKKYGFDYSSWQIDLNLLLNQI